MMARLLSARLAGVDSDWLVVPVPLHRWRLWQRGFNQAAVLAGEVAKLTGASLCVDGLVRKRQTPMLGGLGARERRKVMAGAIVTRPDRAAILQGANVLLIDDVLTSGATSDACVDVLKEAGAKKVVVGCFACVIDEVSEPH